MAQPLGPVRRPAAAPPLRRPDHTTSTEKGRRSDPPALCPSSRSAYAGDMASRLALSWPRLLTVEEFLQIDFGPGLKAELEDGYIPRWPAAAAPPPASR